MKKRVDEIQNFHGTAARSGVSSGATRILTPPTHGVQISPNTAQSQYQILNIREPTQSIQYTYTSAINSSNIQKNNISQQQQPSQNPTVHTVSAGSVNITSTVRSKPTTSGNITPTLTSPTSTAAAQNVSGQNFPRLKVEDALSYLDQVSLYAEKKNSFIVLVKLFFLKKKKKRSRMILT